MLLRAAEWQLVEQFKRQLTHLFSRKRKVRFPSHTGHTASGQRLPFDRRFRLPHLLRFNRTV